MEPTTAVSSPSPITKQRKGFAVMSPATQQAIAQMGGRAAQRNGTAHRWTRAEAQAAGHIGGAKSRRSTSSSAIWQSALARLQEGESVAQVARDTGIATSTLYRHRRRMEREHQAS